jgi:hypothetical protein
MIFLHFATGPIGNRTISGSHSLIWKFKTSPANFEMFVPARVTYLLTPRDRVLLEKLTGLQIVKKFPAFMEPEVHYRIRNCPSPVPILSQLDPAHTPTHPTFWRPILILSSHLHLGLPSGLFPSGFPTKTLHMPLRSPIRATCPAHLIFLYFITRTILGHM